MTNETREPAATETHSSKLAGLSRYTILLICILLLHAGLLYIFFEPASAGIDAHGYTVQAKMIAEHGRVWFPLESPLQFTGPHLLPIYDGQDKVVISRYPPGLPVITAVIYKLFGVNGVFMFNPLLATFTLLGLYLLCRFWMSEFCALCAVIIMAVNPVANSWVYMADSHFLVAFCLVWGLYCLARWSQSFSILYACISGLLLGWIPTIRYAEVIYAPAIAVYMLLYFQNTKRYWYSLLTAAAAASLPLILLAIHNRMVSGSISLNGYTMYGETHLFSHHYFYKHLFPYLINIHWGGLGWFATLGMTGFFTLCHYKPTRREGVLLAGIALSTLVLYMSYFFFDHTQRFLFPTFYLYVIAGVWCFHLLMLHRFHGAWIALILLTAVSALWSSVISTVHIIRIHEQNRMLAEATKVVLAAIPSHDSVVIMPSVIGRHLLFVSDYKIADEDMFLPEKHPAFSQPNAAAIHNAPQSLDSAHRKLMERYKTDTYELPPLLLRDLDQWSDGSKVVYWIGEKSEILAKIPMNDSAEETAMFDMDLRLGEPPPMPPRYKEDANGKNRGGMFQPPPGPPGSVEFGPSDDRDGPGGSGDGGGHPRLKPVTVSIIKWIRN